MSGMSRGFHGRPAARKSPKNPLDGSDAAATETCYNLTAMTHLSITLSGLKPLTARQCGNVLFVVNFILNFNFH